MKPSGLSRSGDLPYLPSLVCSSVVRVVLGDVGVDAAQGQLFVLRGRDGLHNQLRVRIRRFRLVLRSRAVRGRGRRRLRRVCKGKTILSPFFLGS